MEKEAIIDNAATGWGWDSEGDGCAPPPPAQSGMKSDRGILRLAIDCANPGYCYHHNYIDASLTALE